MDRCCSDTITHYAPKAPFLGQEIECRWSCGAVIRYEQIEDTDHVAWTAHDPVGEFVKREANPIATEAREKAYVRILNRERAR